MDALHTGLFTYASNPLVHTYWLIARLSALRALKSTGPDILASMEAAAKQGDLFFLGTAERDKSHERVALLGHEGYGIENGQFRIEGTEVSLVAGNETALPHRVCANHDIGDGALGNFTRTLAKNMVIPRPVR